MTGAGKAPPKSRSIWLYKRHLLVAVFHNTAGTITPTKPPDDGSDLPTCAYASGQFFSVDWEEDLFKGVADCETFDELIRRMKYFKYRVEHEQPRYKRRAFSRL